LQLGRVYLYSFKKVLRKFQDRLNVEHEHQIGLT